MKWHKVEEKLPESSNMDVLGYGIETWEDEDGTHKEPAIEIGFRSKIDDPKKPTEWVDFSFPVTHWAPLPWPSKGDL
jgi:hypothetical protein